ncbi:MAG: signal peptide peptidase SppA [Nanoarchaeota archaeon]
MVDYVKLQDENDKNGKQPPKAIYYKKRRSRLNLKSIIILLLIVFIISSIISSITYLLTPKIGVVPIQGAIMTQKTSTLTQTSISSREIADILRDLKDDNSVKGVILDINSPGGSAVASDEISQAIDELKQVKPVYALINDIGASGAFWIAVSSDKIYSSSMSTLGSIGVTSVGFGFEDLIEEYNITYRRYTAGEHKDMGSAFREPTLKEEKIIDNLLKEIHQNFITHIAKNRNMTYDKVLNYSTGEIFLGTQAKEIGFIDEIGYYPDILSDIKEEVQSLNAIAVDYAPQQSFTEILGINSIFSNSKTKSQILLQKE